MRPDDIFEAFADIDEELVAGAKHIEGCDSQVIVMKRTPLWKTIAGWSAAAACLAVLVVGGIFGIKYFGGKSGVTPPMDASDNIPHGANIGVSYARCEYPAEAKYVFNGDYGDLEYADILCIDCYIYADYDELAAASDLIVSGEFFGNAHQIAPVDAEFDLDKFCSYNSFQIDKVIKGDKEKDNCIAIGQRTSVHRGKIYSFAMSPMICGDKWIYFLKEGDNGCYYPVSNVQGRYPLPDSSNKALDGCNELGYYGNNGIMDSVYEELLEVLEPSVVVVSKNFDGVELTVEMMKTKFKKGEDIQIKATVRNMTDKPIGLYMPVQGEGSHTEISTKIVRGDHILSDISVTGAFADALDSHIVEPGGEYVQEMTFSTLTASSFSDVDYVPGEYVGTATIGLLDDPHDTGSKVTWRLVEFGLTLEGESGGINSPEIEKVYDVTESHNSTLYWTMDEFPGVKFRVTDNVGRVSALTEGVKDENGNEIYAEQRLYEGMPVVNVYLADLNFDGKREIISTVAMGSGIVDGHIEAYDYANNIHYTLENRMYYDYDLRLEDGRLVVAERRYGDSEVMTEQTLTLAMLRGSPVENPVAEIARIDGSRSVSWTMAEFPDVTFSAAFNGIGAEKNGDEMLLFGDVLVENVLLCDLNDDGKCEIIAEIKKNADGYNCAGIRVYDYANDVCHELWADYMHYDLSSYGGTLNVNVWT